MLLIVSWAILPLPNSRPSYSKALYSKEGILLSATISKDQQWCFPNDAPIPEKLKACIITYEDEYFSYHPGINPVAAVKALIANKKAGKVVRGASTLPMQVMRMKNKNATRNWTNKIREILGALKYSLLHSDEAIIKEWSEIAPFGGNTVGIKAASLRYFGREVDQLSWGEYALLAVMPNGPSYANLTKNRSILQQKRNFLLKKLQHIGYFDLKELELYLGEDLPHETKSIPQNAYHALMFLSSVYPEQYIFNTTILAESQLKINELLDRESSFLKMDDIRNMAAVVLNIKTNELISYHGNVKEANGHFSYVDVVQAPRSYGSLLKPLLYAHALETAQLLPNELVADIPTAIGDFQPQNFDKKYRGAVPFEEVLIQSLNVPSVRILNTIGMQSFYNLIKNLDIAYLNRGADYYGLSIILGGGESSLWDLCRIYKGFAQNYRNDPNPYRPILCLTDQTTPKTSINFSFSAGTMDHLVNTMSDLTRPREEKSWQLYGTDYKIAWKTGTSYGHRDAWALGFNGQYMVGVWIGNEGGEGRFDLTGISKAAPVMFKIFNSLPDNQWFALPPIYQKKEILSVCQQSGKLAGPLCKKKSQVVTEIASFKYHQCNYHKEVMLNPLGQIIQKNCADLNSIIDTIFILPSYMEYYYRSSHSEYSGSLNQDPNCQSSDISRCKIIYPLQGMKIFLPKDNIDKQNDLITKAYHRDKNEVLFWFIDDQYVSSTTDNHHENLMKLPIGKHTLTITDKTGNSDQIEFEILKSER